MSLLAAHHLHVALDDQPILRDVSFDLEAGSRVGLLGPNGSGKTTLLRAINGVLPYEGRLQLGGREIQAWSPSALARRMAFVRQSPSLTFDFRVDELVLLGRAPHKSWLQSYSTQDRAMVHAALAQVDLDGFADRSVLSLSGGELQRVFLAQALVQEADLLLLDEPTSHLDVHYQFAFMEQVEALVDRGCAVFAVFHDLELAARHAERLMLLDKGRLVADGLPAEVLTPRRIADVFRMEATVNRAPDGTLRIDYHGQVGTRAPAPRD